MGYMVMASIVLYCYITMVHVVLCYVKSLFLYRWSRRSNHLIENAFETEFELDDDLSDVTELGDGDLEKVVLKEIVAGNGVVISNMDEKRVCTKIVVEEDTVNVSSPSPNESQVNESEVHVEES